MNKTIDEIYSDAVNRYKELMQDAGININPSLWSTTSVLRILFYAISVIVHIHQGMLQSAKSELDTLVKNKKPGILNWYREVTLGFQFGHVLPLNEIEYDNSGIEQSVIDASKVVKHCAVVPMNRGVHIKVAGESAGDLAALPAAQELALMEYLSRVIYAGVRINLTNGTADYLFADLTIYYDPLILDAQGRRLDGTNNAPVEQALDDYLKALTFNGLLVHMKLIDALQEVEGVVIPVANELKARYALVGWLPFEVSYLPQGGYIRRDVLNINYIPHGPI